MKRILLLLVSLAAPCFCAAEAPAILSSSFEDGKTGDWTGRGSAVLTATKDTAHSGKLSLLTTGRTQSWNGPSVDLTGKILPGGAYRFSAWVKI